MIIARRNPCAPRFAPLAWEAKIVLTNYSCIYKYARTKRGAIFGLRRLVGPELWEKHT